MKKLILVVLSCAFLMPVFAQDDASANDAGEVKKEKKEKKPSKVGNFLRRVGESTTGINMSNETFVAIAFEAQQMVDFAVQSCTGDPNTGTVLLTLTAKAKKNGVKTNLGKRVNNSDYVTAYDAKGATFEGKEVGSYTEIGRKDNPAGVPVQYQFVFSDVPTTVAQIEVVQVEFYIDSNDNHIGSNMSSVEPMQVRNIPIAWGALE